ncbi:ATP-binding cassette domain-containing protein [Filimonas effusa]|uniref:ATP-binding cassette domain-containing protein n=1 Tax=Filimonas effusa TaxID=2508721 RepID=A0A4Q1DBD6_9BACT|nr:ATP-binding cassette domain-containing protein [Filimonas effusa]RXK86752.1 ATP-binding cassette domain-containing protein [Filimonas effusa]
MKHVFRADGIQLSFGLRCILSDIYIGSETGMITGLLGRNGQGKSCLMNIIYGTLPTTDKSVRVDDARLLEAFRRPDLLTYLPQFNYIPKHLRLRRIFLDFELSFDHFLSHFPEYQKVYELPVGSLSGGQRRLVEVYCLIKSKALFTMLDEPFSHLSPVQVERLKLVMEEELPAKGFLVTDHMYHYLLGFCHQVYVLQNGKTHLTKSREDIERLGYLAGA